MKEEKNKIDSYIDISFGCITAYYSKSICFGMVWNGANMQNF